MNTLLINPDHGNAVNNYPWGVLSVGSYLKQRGQNVRLLDLSNFPGNIDDKIEEAIEWAHLVGIGMFSSDVPTVLDIVDRIKSSRQDINIICGGPHVVLEPELTCQYKNIDFTAYGEGEKTIESLISELEKENPNFDNVPSLIYKSGGETKRTAKSEQFVDFYDIDYTLLDAQVRETFGDYIQVLTSRGCSFRCTFCYNPVINQVFRPRPAEGFTSELDKIVSEYNPKIVYFRDENFLQEKERIHEFIRLYKEKDYTFRWRATSRVGYMRDRYINDEMLKNLEDINLETLKFGVESGSQRVLNFIKKGLKVAWINEAARRVSRSNVNGSFSFMIGMPTETYKDYVETMMVQKELVDLDNKFEIIGPQYFRLYPGGDLYNQAVEGGYIGKPKSLEEYAEVFRNDRLGVHHYMPYPWIEKKARYLTRYANWLLYFYTLNNRELLKPNNWYLLPISLMAKLRFRFKWFSYLYELHIAVTLAEKLPIIKKLLGGTRYWGIGRPNLAVPGEYPGGQTSKPHTGIDKEAEAESVPT